MQEAKKLKHKADALVGYRRVGGGVPFHYGAGCYKNVHSECRLKLQKPRGTLLLTKVCFRLYSMDTLSTSQTLSTVPSL